MNIKKLWKENSVVKQNKEEKNIKNSGEKLNLNKLFNTLDKYTEFWTFIIFISFF